MCYDTKDRRVGITIARTSITMMIADIVCFVFFLWKLNIVPHLNLSIIKGILYMISPLFTTIVLVAGFIWIYMKTTTKNLGKSEEELVEKELKANSVRRMPLNTLNYIKFNKSCLPEIDSSISPTISNLLDTLSTLYDQNIVNLTGISNTDLKLAYGPANLPDLTQFDQNYDLLTRTLNDLGTNLYTLDYKAEAASVLEYAISIGSDISATYLTLANIYVQDNRYKDISNLILNAEMLTSLTKNSTISKLKEILDTHTTIDIPMSSAAFTPSKKTNNSTEDISITDIDSIPPKDIRDILDSVLYTDPDQK